MDIDALRNQVKARFNPLVGKEVLSPAPISEPSSAQSKQPVSMLDEALRNRLAAEQENIQVSQEDRDKLLKKLQEGHDDQLMLRLLRGHD